MNECVVLCRVTILSTSPLSEEDKKLCIRRDDGNIQNTENIVRGENGWMNA